MRYFLHCVKNTANICQEFCEAQKFAVAFAERKNTAKIIAKTNQKIYGNRKYLRYILGIAKICVNINDIFCGAQKIPKNYRKNKPKISMAIANICDIFCVLQKFA